MDRKMKLTFSYMYSSGLKERVYLRYRSASASSSTTTGAIKEQPQQPYRQVTRRLPAQGMDVIAARRSLEYSLHQPDAHTTQQPVMILLEKEVAVGIAWVLTDPSRSPAAALFWTWRRGWRQLSAGRSSPPS